MSQLPMQIRIGIRDSWQKPESPVQQAFKALSQVVGLEVYCEPEWPMLWAELEKAFPDKTTFVPTIAKWVAVWSDVLKIRLDDDKNSEWADELLNKLNDVQNIKLFISVSHEEVRPKVSFSNDKPAFILLIPAKTTQASLNPNSGFYSDFEALFSQNSTQKNIDVPKDDEWADIDSAGNSTNVAIRELNTISDALLDVQTLARPDLLFPTVSPYILRMTCSGTTMTLQGTHEPSIKLLEAYFKKWVKIDPHDTRRPPFLKIKLVESLFGPGLFYDTLEIEPYDTNQARRITINPTLVQAFIEGVMEYKPVQSSSDRAFCEFRKYKA